MFYYRISSEVLYCRRHNQEPYMWPDLQKPTIYTQETQNNYAYFTKAKL